MRIKLRFQLSTLMFLQYFVWGTWYVTITTYLTTTLHFEPLQAGLVFGTFSIAAMISQFFVGLIADKFFATEKTLGTLHLLGAAVLILTSLTKSFPFFYASMLLYSMCYTPTIALSNSVSFHQMKDPGKEFPSIRVLGTIGWIAAGMTIGFMKVESSVFQLYVGAIVSALLGIYCFTLPHVPPKREAKVSFKEIIGLDALKLFKEQSFALIIIASVLTCIPLAFYYSWTNPFLNEVGMKFAASKMTMGQMSEIIFMLIMPFFFIRLGVKRMIMIGIAAWVIRYLLFAYGNVDSLVWMLYAGIILHGICYDFFFVTGQIFVDKKAPDYLKGSAQGMITFATYGLGMFIGAWFSGVVVGRYTSEAGGVAVHEWTPIWLIPMAIAAFVLLLFALLFRSSDSDKKVEVSSV